MSSEGSRELFSYNDHFKYSKAFILPFVRSTPPLLNEGDFKTETVKVLCDLC
jgi:hypothetical protein